MSIPLYILIFITIPLGAILLALFLSGTKNLLRSKGLYTQKDNKLIYPLGPILGIISILPSLLFNQYLNNNSFLIFNSQFYVYIACLLILLLVSIKADFHKIYLLQWLILWLIIAILLNDFGSIIFFPSSQFSILNSQFLYWLSLLSLYLLLFLLHLITSNLPKSPLKRSWILLPSLIGSFTYLFIHHLYNGIFLPATMIGVFLLSTWLNRRDSTSAWDPGFASVIVTTFSLFWLTLIQPTQHQLWLGICWLIPLFLIIIWGKLQKHPYKDEFQASP